MEPKPKLHVHKKGRYNLPPQRRVEKNKIKKKSTPGGTSSGFAFRSWELTNLTVQIFALCPSRNNVGVIFIFFFLRKHCLNMLTVCRCICFGFPRFPGNAQMLATLSGQLLHYRSEM